MEMCKETIDIVEIPITQNLWKKRWTLAIYLKIQ